MTLAQSESRPLPASMSVEHPNRRLERLSPLIHELLSRDLVYRADGGEFVLREDVQERLEELSAIPPPMPQVYIGRKCEVCGSARVTRLVEGTRTCGDCSGSASGAPISSSMAPRLSTRAGVPGPAGAEATADRPYAYLDAGVSPPLPPMGSGGGCTGPSYGESGQ